MKGIGSMKRLSNGYVALLVSVTMRFLSARNRSST